MSNNLKMQKDCIIFPFICRKAELNDKYTKRNGYRLPVTGYRKNFFDKLEMPVAERRSPLKK